MSNQNNNPKPIEPQRPIPTGSRVIKDNGEGNVK